MSYKHRIYLSLDSSEQSDESIYEEFRIKQNLLPQIRHYIVQDNTYDELCTYEPQNYIFKVVVGDNIVEGATLVDYSAEFTVTNLPYKGMKHVFGTSCWQITFANASQLFLNSRTGTIEILLQYYSSLDNRICIDIIPASFSDIVKTVIPISEFVESSQQSASTTFYGYKILTYYSANNSDEVPYRKLMFASENESKLSLGFHEVVFDSKENLQIQQLSGQEYIYYVKEASFTDYLYSRIIEKFTENGDGNIQRYSEIKLSKSFIESVFKEKNKAYFLHVDLGGEGKLWGRDQNSNTYSCGFDDAINLNSQFNISSSENGCNLVDCDSNISHLIYMENWEKDFPFENDCITFLTMQSIPVPDPANSNYQKEYCELVRCMEETGVIAIWCVGEDDVNAAKNLQEYFHDNYKSYNGYVEASLFNRESTNIYERFFAYLPTCRIGTNGTVIDIIPVIIYYEDKTGFIGFDKAAKLSFRFNYSDLYKKGPVSL